jgi:TPR repeat protein
VQAHTLLQATGLRLFSATVRRAAQAGRERNGDEIRKVCAAKKLARSQPIVAGFVPEEVYLVLPGDPIDVLMARARKGEARACIPRQATPGRAKVWICLSRGGVALLREAVLRGDGEAAAQLAVCAAWGVSQGRDINAALDHLLRAADLGWAPAQRELAATHRDAHRFLDELTR